MDYEKGEVVLVPFPFADLTAAKQRPTLIISSKSYNKKHAEVLIIAITSQIPSSIPPEEYLLSSEEQQAGGLLKRSLVKTGKIFAIDKRQIRKSLGMPPDKSIKQIEERLRKIIDF